jgi:transposase-like protein
MNIIERGRVFAKRLGELAARSVWDWKQCPHCRSRVTIKNGSYRRHPWGFAGRDTVLMPRHLCRGCGKSYAETSALMVRGSWYYREVQRAAVDHWQHLGTSLRRTAEVLRSWIGHQERWQLWRPLDTPGRERCYLTASTVHRWLDRAGQRAAASVPDQLAGIGRTHEPGRTPEGSGSCNDRDCGDPTIVSRTKQNQSAAIQRLVHRYEERTIL